jgi:hypothetical protein
VIGLRTAGGPVGIGIYDWMVAGMTNAVDVKAGVDGSEGNAVKLGYEISYGDGAKAFLEVLVVPADRPSADVSSADIEVSRRSVLLDLLRALEAWEAAGGYIRP